ncbi:hypothetical protein BD310DRAFT_805158, partial [Dichomitus squalens]
PQSQTCVPALIPPGDDPSQVDIRTFYPTPPTSMTKVNASLRKKLAAELDMTPCGVQVRPRLSSPSRPIH